MTSAERFFRVLLHELGHVLDYQRISAGENLSFNSYSSPGSMRRMAHDKRPQEIRADEHKERALKTVHADNEILELALYLDEGR